MLSTYTKFLDGTLLHSSLARVLQVSSVSSPAWILLLPPGSLDCMCEPPCLLVNLHASFYSVQEIKPKSWCMLGKHSFQWAASALFILPQNQSIVWVACVLNRNQMSEPNSLSIFVNQAHLSQERVNTSPEGFLLDWNQLASLLDGYVCHN